MRLEISGWHDTIHNGGETAAVFAPHYYPRPELLYPGAALYPLPREPSIGDFYLEL